MTFILLCGDAAHTRQVGSRLGDAEAIAPVPLCFDLGYAPLPGREVNT